MIYVDKDGNWFHKGAPLVHRGLIGFFYQLLDTDPQGCYIIRLQNQICRLEVEDTPFVIVRTDFVSAERNMGRAAYMLRLIDGTQEELDPAGLFVGSENVLYCKVKEGRFKARFARCAYYQLAEYIRPDYEAGKYVLPLNHKTYPISAIRDES